MICIKLITPIYYIKKVHLKFTLNIVQNSRNCLDHLELPGE